MRLSKVLSVGDGERLEMVMIVETHSSAGFTWASHKLFAAGELTVAGQQADRWVAKPLESRWECLIGTLAHRPRKQPTLKDTDPYEMLVSLPQVWCESKDKNCHFGPSRHEYCI